MDRSRLYAVGREVMNASFRLPLNPFTTLKLGIWGNLALAKQRSQEAILSYTGNNQRSIFDVSPAHSLNALKEATSNLCG